MKKILLPSLLLLLTLPAGCNRMLAAASGPAPVGAGEGERTLSQRMEDISIEKTAAINLYKLDPRFTQSRVVIMSFYSQVLLVGQVPDESLRRLAVSHVKSLREVSGVHDELTIAPVPIPLLARAKDSVISARIRSALTFAKGFPSSQCKVLVEDGVVYVMAKLKRPEAEQAVALIRATPDVRRVVTLVDYLPD